MHDAAPRAQVQAAPTASTRYGGRWRGLAVAAALGFGLLGLSGGNDPVSPQDAEAAEAVPVPVPAQRASVAQVEIPAEANDTAVEPEAEPPEPQPLVQPVQAAALAQPPLLAPKQAFPPLTRHELLGFENALRGLQNGSLNRPVTILHLGDSHIASDSLTREIRKLLQRQFGDAGRGLMQPFGAVPYQQAAGISFQVKGNWTFANSLKVHSGPFGITGARATSGSADAQMSLLSQGNGFDWAEVTLLTGPSEGSVRIAVGDHETAASGKAAKAGSRIIRVTQSGERLSIRPMGDAPVTVLGWATGKSKPGVRYTSLGIPGAKLSVTSSWNADQITRDVSAIAPDLIILGYGTNEAFDGNLQAPDYLQTVLGLIERLKAAAPNASLLIITPPDVAHQARGAKAGANACGERLDGTPYGSDKIQAERRRRTNGWEAPPSLWTVRRTLEEAAHRSGAFVWDWSLAMGGPCGVDQWADMSPPLAGPDHVHQTPRGYDRSSRALFEVLMADYKRFSATAHATLE